MGFDRAVKIGWVVTRLVWIRIGWFGGGVVIDDGGVKEVGVAVGGEGVDLLVWIWVCFHGSRFGFVVGLGLGFLPRVVGIVGCFFFFFWC